MDTAGQITAINREFKKLISGMITREEYDDALKKITREAQAADRDTDENVRLSERDPFKEAAKNIGSG